MCSDLIYDPKAVTDIDFVVVSFLCSLIISLPTPFFCFFFYKNIFYVFYCYYQFCCGVFVVVVVFLKFFYKDCTHVVLFMHLFSS